MDTLERYDVIVLGSGFTECLLGNLLLIEGKKVLQLDRERFSGGENGYISSYEELQEMFNSTFIKEGDWNVDLIPKFFVGKDKMMKLLEYIGIKLNLKPIHSVLLSANSELIKVPNSSQQVETCRFIHPDDKKEYKRLIADAKKPKPKKAGTVIINKNGLLKSYKLSPPTNLIVAHGMCVGEELQADEDLLDHICRFCDNKHHQATSLSFPEFGLGDLIQSLLRRFTQRGGRFMTNRPISNVKISEGMVRVSASGLTAMASVVVGDPTYFEDMVESVGKVIRGLCVVDHQVLGTEKSRSGLIIIPGSEVKRKSDIIVSYIGEDHMVAPRGMYIAHVCTTSETNGGKDEINPGIDLLGKICASQIKVKELFKQKDEGNRKIFVSSSYDSSINWESVYSDVSKIYEKITGKDILDKLK